MAARMNVIRGPLLTHGRRLHHLTISSGRWRTINRAEWWMGLIPGTAPRCSFVRQDAGLDIPVGLTFFTEGHRLSKAAHRSCSCLKNGKVVPNPGEETRKQKLKGKNKVTREPLRSVNVLSESASAGDLYAGSRAMARLLDVVIWCVCGGLWADPAGKKHQNEVLRSGGFLILYCGHDWGNVRSRALTAILISWRSTMTTNRIPGELIMTKPQQRQKCDPLLYLKPDGVSRENNITGQAEFPRIASGTFGQAA